jgi:hypothetical protein
MCPLLVFAAGIAAQVVERIRRRQVAVFDGIAPEPAELKRGLTNPG